MSLPIYEPEHSDIKIIPYPDVLNDHTASLNDVLTTRPIPTEMPLPTILLTWTPWSKDHPYSHVFNDHTEGLNNTLTRPLPTEMYFPTILRVWTPWPKDTPSIDMSLATTLQALTTPWQQDYVLPRCLYRLFCKPELAWNKDNLLLRCPEQHPDSKAIPSWICPANKTIPTEMSSPTIPRWWNLNNKTSPYKINKMSLPSKKPLRSTSRARKILV